ncbi:unnamed protein product [Prorocentrum cordatum]|uniref:Uncharacterized protein n=1 Tax=Prorocentrum cordatum TaxID=2364126 RepID=A0ABN9VFB7_9DINO|nr:unnamed protein product [Polarella glacialis]
MGCCMASRQAVAPKDQQAGGPPPHMPDVAEVPVPEDPQESDALPESLAAPVDQQHQQEVPKKEEQETFDLWRYTNAASLFHALAFTVEGLHPVRLVRMSWLLQQRGTVLNRRQELPEEAFVSADELRAVWKAGGRGGLDGVAPIITISFCWDAREHPDPNGVQLSLVIDTLEAERRKYSTAKGDFKGFSEMGIFWDWPSLLQGDPIKAEEARAAALRQGKTKKDAQEAADKAKRTPAEKAAFKHGLEETMDLWYAHRATTVLLLTQHPRERGSAREWGYDQSGWTTYERCSAEQIKQVYRSEAEWAAVADLGQGTYAAAAGRRWPVGPDEFDRLIEDRSFTNGADREAVKALFRRMSRAQLGGVTTLDFEGMRRPTPEQAAGLASCLRLCARLQVLRLSACQIGAEGRAGLGGGAALPARPAAADPAQQQHRRRGARGPWRGRCPPCPACRSWACTTTASAPRARGPWRGRCPPCPACSGCTCTTTASAGTERRRCGRPGAAGAACLSEPGAPAQGGTREWREGWREGRRAGGRPPELSLSPLHAIARESCERATSYCTCEKKLNYAFSPTRKFKIQCANYLIQAPTAAITITPLPASFPYLPLVSSSSLRAPP